MKEFNTKDTIITIVIALAFAITFLFMVTSCATGREYRNKVVEKHDTIRITNTELRIDSIWRDRVQLVEVKGDSVYIRDSVVVEKWRIKNVVDTFWRAYYLNDVDSVYVETPTVTRERSKYDIFTSYGFWIELGILVLLFVGFIIYVFVKMKKLV